MLADDGVVDAGETYRALIAAIAAAGGPAYDFRDVPPVDDQDGGEDGGNIREQLLTLSDFDFTCTYSILESPMGVSNYIATLKLAPVTDGDRHVFGALVKASQDLA